MKTTTPIVPDVELESLSVAEKMVLLQAAVLGISKHLDILTTSGSMICRSRNPDLIMLAHILHEEAEPALALESIREIVDSLIAAHVSVEVS